jgi:hypothetical protein
MSPELDNELVRALFGLAPVGTYMEMFTLVRRCRERGLTDARAEATLAAILLGASYAQVFEMLEAGWS